MTAAGPQTGDIIIGCRKKQEGYEEDFRIIDSLSLEEIDHHYLLIHAGIVDIVDGEVCVLDVTKARGVARRNLELFRQDFTRPDGTIPVFFIMRSRENLGGLWIENARRHLGETYSQDFLEHEGALYCTELLQKCCVDKDGKEILSRQPMDFLEEDGTMPEFWTRLFGSISMDVPQGMMGSNPRAFVRCCQLVRTHARLM